MALQVKDLIQQKGFKGFRLEAGKKGLDRYVAMTGILDYEYFYGVDDVAVPFFDENSFVISSLLFAKDDPELILSALQRLNETGVAAFAYKRVFFDQLPQDALDYADEHAIPIFSFGRELYFETVIFDIMAAIRREDERIFEESKIKYILENDLSLEDAALLKSELSLKFKPYVAAVYFKTIKEGVVLSTDRLLNNYYHNKPLHEKSLPGSYDGGFFIIMTSKEESLHPFQLILKEFLETNGIDINTVRTAFSDVGKSDHDIPRCIRESYCAYKAATLEHVDLVNYSDIGTWQFLIPNLHSRDLRAYASDYINLFKHKKTLMDTAFAWIETGGDFLKAAEKLSCHQNTIRYRVSNMKKLMEPNLDLTDFQFFERLAAAVRIFKALDSQ